MMNLFEIASKDASMCYLSKVFGNVSGVIVCNDPTIGFGGNDTLLSSMFKTFNSTILTIAVLLLVYVTIIGVIGTAHEGEFLGKKMNNIWVPIRAVLGVALLVPTGAGYCGIQILMMWVIVQGIGAADTLWNTALSYINTVGSPYAQVSVVMTGKELALNGLFQGLTCDASVRKGDPKGLGGQACLAPGGCGGATPTFDPNATSYEMGINGNCGRMVYCNQGSTTVGGVAPSCSDPNSMQCYACKAQIKALTIIVPTFAGIAQQLVNADYSYRDFFVNSSDKKDNPEWNWIYKYCDAAKPKIDPDKCCVAGLNTSGLACKASFPTKMPAVEAGKFSASSKAVMQVYWPYWPGLEPSLGSNVSFGGNQNNSIQSQEPMQFVTNAKRYYADLADGAVTDYIQAQKGKDVTDKLSETIQASQSAGWIFAGALYYQLASLNSDRLKGSVTTLDWKVPSKPSSIPRNNIQAAGYLVGASAGSDPAAVAAQQNKQLNLGEANFQGAQEGADDLQASMKDIQNSFNTAVTNTGDENPLIKLQGLGTTLLIIAQAVFFVLMAIEIVLAMVAAIDILALGTGVLDPLKVFAPMMNAFFLPLIYGVLGLLVSIGAILSIYTPLLPYMYFIFGALFWMVSTVEAMVAGPLVALGIISPSGQHEIMGKAEPALGLLFNIFLRPSLMIFGLMAAMLLAIVGVLMVNATFGMVKANASTDPLTSILMLVAYFVIILAVLNKCFAVINLIPQQVTRWISIQGEAVETPLQEMKGQMDSASGVASGIPSQAGDRMKARSAEENATLRELKEDKKKGMLDKKDSGVKPKP